MLNIRCTQTILTVALGITCLAGLTGCTQGQEQEFVDSYNDATSIEFNIPYVDSNKLLVGYEMINGVTEDTVKKTILSQAFPKQSDGNYLMTNTTLMGTLCNKDNELGYYLNPAIQQPVNTLTIENKDKIETVISDYMANQLLGKNLGETAQEKQISQKYVIQNIIYSIFPTRDYQGKAINPYETTITRAHAMVGLVSAMYGRDAVDELNKNVDTEVALKLQEALNTAVSNGLMKEDAVPYKFIHDNIGTLAWADQFAYLKVSEGEMGAVGLFKEITYGELQYFIQNLLVHRGELYENSIIHMTDASSLQDKKLTGGYTVKTLGEIREKAQTSNKMVNSNIPDKQTALFRQMYIEQAKNTVEPDLYSTFVQTRDLGFHDGTKGITDTVTINDIYKELLGISDYMKSNAITWSETKKPDIAEPKQDAETEPETQTEQGLGLNEGMVENVETVENVENVQEETMTQPEETMTQPEQTGTMPESSNTSSSPDDLTE